MRPGKPIRLLRCRYVPADFPLRSRRQHGPGGNDLTIPYRGMVKRESKEIPFSLQENYEHQFRTRTPE